MRRMKRTASDWVFDAVIAIFAAVVICITLYPLIYVFSMSISNPINAARGEVWLLPKGFDLTAMKKVLEDESIFRYYYNTVWYTVVGTVLGIITTALGAYPLARKEFTYRNFFMKMIMVTMFFGGGLIPTYIVVAKFLNLYNTRWAVILPGLTSAWNIVVARTYFASLPEEIIESARLDGASEYRIFAQLIVPLSKPILSVLALYYAVGLWNSYFGPMIYLGKEELQPLALYIRSVMMQNTIESVAGSSVAIDVRGAALLSSLQIKYAVIVIAVLPMMLIYPLISKNLEKGLMVGAIKA